MKQTENFGLKQLESSDLLSAAPLNENAALIDAALQAHQTAISGRLKAVGGRYTGDGTMSVTIETPGIRPQILLMYPIGTRVGAVQKIPYPTQSECSFNSASMNGQISWYAWRGEDVSLSYYALSSGSGDDATYKTSETRVAFTPVSGSISWNLAAEVPFDQPVLVNNASGEIYEWIAFGVAED